MDRQLADTWIEAYRQAWEQTDAAAAASLFTEDASYRSHPLQPAHTGRDGVAAYWTEVTADQRDPRVRFGDPLVDGGRVAVEWWTTMVAGGDPITLAGCLVLAFAADGRCRDLRECWNLAEGLRDPFPGWGRLDLDPGGRAGEHARRWAAGYERAWRATDPEAAAALYAPDTTYRSEPFRDPHPGRAGVLAYTRDAYATEADQDPHFGTPVAAGASAAVEWWAPLLEAGQPSTLIGTSLLTFTPDGLVVTGRDYWFQEPGAHPPYEHWGR
jgi:predicted SnoaL-like aldol condensation-catalyzing enzyme